MPAVDCKITMENKKCFIVRFFDGNILLDVWECKNIEIDPVALQGLVKGEDDE